MFIAPQTISNGRVNDDQADPVRVFDRANLIDTRDDHLLESLAHVIHTLDDQSEVVEDRAQFIGGLGEFNELT